MLPLAGALVVILALVAPTASAQPEPRAYGEGTFPGFRDVLPPGAGGRANLAELATFRAGGPRPPHSDDQTPLYRDLLHTEGLPDVARFFKDSTLGVRPEDVERRYSPRADVTIVRDRFGVPHVYGATRAGTLFGIGYATAEDRLFFMDVLRHLGRGQLSSFAGGNPFNRSQEQLIWKAAPYTEADLERQVTQPVPRQFAHHERDAAVLRADLREYTAGVNAYIAEARADPRKMPGEYAGIGRPEGPDDWRLTDAVAIAIVPGAVLGTGGGREVESALVLEEARRRFGAVGGARVWRDFRQEDDPEAPTTVRGREFPYANTPRRRARGSLALPDPGSVRAHDLVTAATGSGSAGVEPATPRAGSNSLLVSARESESGRPIAVFGPQVGYFSPEVLMEQEIYAPARDGLPGLHARGASFPGTNLFVQLGHGVDYAWSATTAAADQQDTFAVDLCEPDGSRPTVRSMHYRFRGACLEIEVLERHNAWSPSPGDPTPAGSETLRMERTKLGLVEARATVRGRPVAYTRLRSTYFHEPDSALGFSFLNDPERVRDARGFLDAAYLVAYAFNLFYVDDRQIAYLSAGSNPVRARGADPNLPVRGLTRFLWRDWDPETATATIEPLSRHPHVVDQAWIADWNNKQAKGYAAADGNWGYGPVYRVKPLADRIRAGTRGAAKMSLPELVAAMRDAATVDLRGAAVLPLALRVLGRPRDPELARAVELLDAWRRDGAHRIDRDQDGRYEHAEAIRIMDAWWPRWLRAEFEPVLGERLFGAIQGIVELDNHPNNNGEHYGSAWQDGWYGHAHRDLRRVLGMRVRGRRSRVYCGRGRIASCRRALESSLREAIAVPEEELYDDPVCAAEGRSGDQACFDSLWFRPTGGITHPLLPWQNRPTYQQAVEVQGHRPR